MKDIKKNLSVWMFSAMYRQRVFLPYNFFLTMYIINVWCAHYPFLLYHGHLLLIPYDIRDAFTNRLLGSCQKRAFGKVQKTKRLSKHICPYISSPPPSCCHAGGTIVFQFQFVCTLAPPLSGGHFLSILGTFTILLRITLFFYKNKVYKNIKPQILVKS